MKKFNLPRGNRRRYCPSHLEGLVTVHDYYFSWKEGVYRSPYKFDLYGPVTAYQDFLEANKPNPLPEDDSLKQAFIFLLLSPIFIFSDAKKGFLHFLKPYQHRNQFKHDLYIPLKRNLANLLRNIAMGIVFPFAILGFAIHITFKIFEAIYEKTRCVLDHFAILKLLSALIVFAIFFPIGILIGTFASLPILFFTIKNAISFLLTPLVYLVGIPCRALITLFKKPLSSSPLDIENIQDISKLNESLQQELESAELSVTLTSGVALYKPTDAAKEMQLKMRAIIELLHHQIEYGLKNNRINYIDPEKEKQLYEKIFHTDRNYLSQEQINYVREYLLCISISMEKVHAIYRGLNDRREDSQALPPLPRDIITNHIMPFVLPQLNQDELNAVDRCEFIYRSLLLLEQKSNHPDAKPHEILSVSDSSKLTSLKTMLTNRTDSFRNLQQQVTTHSDFSRFFKSAPSEIAKQADTPDTQPFITH